MEELRKLGDVMMSQIAFLEKEYSAASGAAAKAVVEVGHQPIPVESETDELHGVSILTWEQFFFARGQLGTDVASNTSGLLGPDLQQAGPALPACVGPGELALT